VQKEASGPLKLNSWNCVASGGVHEPSVFLLVKPAGYGLGIFSG